jgi:hypothetical protein
MVKIKGYRFECEVCQVRTSIQVFFRADGQVGYARARHLGENKRFYYHQQSIDYVNSKLGELSNIEHGQGLKGKSIEQAGIESGLKVKLMVGPPGFEPESIEPKSTSLDQASRRPQNVGCNTISSASIKTLSKQAQKTISDLLGYCLFYKFLKEFWVYCHRRLLQGTI